MSNRNNGEEAKWNYKCSEQQHTKQNQNGMGGRKGLRKVWPGSDKVVPHNKAPVPFFGGVLFVLHPRNSSRWPALAKTCLVEEKWEEGELSQPQLINLSFAYPHKHPLEGSTCTAATRISPWLIRWFHYDEEVTESMIKQEVKQKNGNGHE